MLKKVLLMAAVALLGLPGLAHAQLGRGEISVGYGVAPVTDWIDAYSDTEISRLRMVATSLSKLGICPILANSSRRHRTWTGRRPP